MKIEINTQADLDAFLQFYEELREAGNRQGLPRILTFLANNQKEADEELEDVEDVEFFLHEDILPSSYRYNPSALAQFLTGKGLNWNRVLANRCENGINVTFTDSPKPPTIRELLIAGLQKPGMSLKVHISLLPQTYRWRPDLLTRELSLRLGHKVGYKRKSGDQIVFQS